MPTREDTKSTDAADQEWGMASVTECPYAFYSRLREEGPVHHVPGTNIYLVSRWDDIADAVKRTSELLQPGPPGGTAPEASIDGPTVCKYAPQPAVMSNGADHRIKRDWGLRLVKPDRLQTYRPLIESICDELLDAFPSSGKCEFRWSFAEPLPSWVMMDLLGLPRQDAVLFQRDEIGRPEDFESWHDYVRRHLEARLEEPTDDFLTELLQIQIERDGAVDINFQIAQAANLIRAGSETTAHVLSTMMAVLGQDLELQERVRQDQSLIPVVVEEAMRIDSPVQGLPRVAAVDTEIGGVPIPKGATVWLMSGSGNRDPRKFDDPDTFRLDRPGVGKMQLGFGRGPHLCLGAPLARLEGVIAFEKLLTRFASIEVIVEESDLSNVMKEPGSLDEQVYDDAGQMRGPTLLQIRYDEAG